MKVSKGHKRPKVIYIRRILQVFVISVLIAVPILTMNPSRWSPSRIVQGHLPPPSVRDISGDTWVFTIKGFRLVHPVAFIEGVLSSKVIYIPFLVGVLIPLGLTVILGRVFCSWLCPVGFFLELNQRTNRALKRLGFNKDIRLPDLRYLLIFIMLTLSFFLATPVVSAIDPPHVLGRELMYLFTHQRFSISGIALLLGILLFETFSTSRIWCGRLCPAGGGLSILGGKRLLRIGMEEKLCNRCMKCNDACPYDLQPEQLVNRDNDFNWQKCDNCGLCRDSCPTGAIDYRIGWR